MTPRDIIQIFKQFGWKLYPGKRFGYPEHNVLTHDEDLILIPFEGKIELTDEFVSLIERDSGVPIRSIYKEKNND